MKVKVISLPFIFQVLYVLCFNRPRYQVSVYRTNGPLVFYIYIKISAVTEAGKVGGQLAKDFFKEEYMLNSKIGEYLQDIRAMS